MSFQITYAVGDVHGRADLLEAVIEHALADASAKHAVPRFVFLGDICDRGARSRQALDLVAETIASFPGSFLVRGNHDDWFLQCMNGSPSCRVATWLGRGGLQTLESYLPGDPNGAAELVRTIYRDHLRLIEQSKDIVIEGNIAYTHAGVDPLRPIGCQRQHDLMWVRETFLDHVGMLGAVVVHGHSVVGDRPVVTENRVSIDTGAYKSGRLTVAVVEGMGFRFFQTDGKASVVADVEPVLFDRGMGTAMDSIGATEWRMAA